jgi:hypothetical protein
MTKQVTENDQFIAVMEQLLLAFSSPTSQTVTAVGYDGMIS